MTIGSKAAKLIKQTKPIAGHVARAVVMAQRASVKGESTYNATRRGVEASILEAARLGASAVSSDASRAEAVARRVSHSIARTAEKSTEQARARLKRSLGNGVGQHTAARASQIVAGVPERSIPRLAREFEADVERIGAAAAYSKLAAESDRLRRSAAKGLAAEAVSESFVGGLMQEGRRLGIESWVWDTADDEDVCPICAPLDGTPIESAGDAPPAHPNCRCVPDPVVF